MKFYIYIQLLKCNYTVSFPFQKRIFSSPEPFYNSHLFNLSGITPFSLLILAISRKFVLKIYTSCFYWIQQLFQEIKATLKLPIWARWNIRQGRGSGRKIKVFFDTFWEERAVSRDVSSIHSRGWPTAAEAHRMQNSSVFDHVLKSNFSLELCFIL